MNHYHLSATALPHQSRRLAKAAVFILADMIADKDLLYDVDLALSEACANVVRHAYRDLPPGPLEIDLTIHPGQGVDIEVSDQGKGFSVWPVTIENAGPEAEGGRGLYIMKRLAKTFELRKDVGRNTVFLRMDVEPSKWKQPV